MSKNFGLLLGCVLAVVATTGSANAQDFRSALKIDSRGTGFQQWASGYEEMEHKVEMSDRSADALFTGRSPGRHAMSDSTAFRLPDGSMFISRFDMEIGHERSYCGAGYVAGADEAMVEGGFIPTGGFMKLQGRTYCPAMPRNVVTHSRLDDVR
ncbi:hypothetical protein [Stratiformator vulcanicus]|uniref:Uncharacterized protein n=1 Tax=Stratiformator vulcanicus TaxID=2527980 RepID=A0A517QWQ4_9PLAN|nr:hypothetical protein [Stratiformator vulcanicus]QDT36013.1 hypothetical protein Pan189_03680 [Stratiformator vulcanicus]